MSKGGDSSMSNTFKHQNYSFSDSNVTNHTNRNVGYSHQDWIDKKSRYLGSWRSRYAVLKRYNFTFILCTYKQDYNITYTSFKKIRNTINPTEVMVIDYNTTITTHDGSYKQYSCDRFNIYLNESNERYQLKYNPNKSKYGITEWIKQICSAKLMSQQLLHRMIPFYILQIVREVSKSKYIPI